MKPNEPDLMLLPAAGWQELSEVVTGEQHVASGLAGAGQGLTKCLSITSCSCFPPSWDDREEWP